VHHQTLYLSAHLAVTAMPIGLDAVNVNIHQENMYSTIASW